MDITFVPGYQRRKYFFKIKSNKDGRSVKDIIVLKVTKDNLINVYDVNNGNHFCPMLPAKKIFKKNSMVLNFSEVQTSTMFLLRNTEWEIALRAGYLAQPLVMVILIMMMWRIILNKLKIWRKKLKFEKSWIVEKNLKVEKSLKIEKSWNFGRKLKSWKRWKFEKS